MSHFSDIPLPPGWATAQIGEVAEINPGLNKSGIDDRVEVAFVPMPAVEAESGRIDVSSTRKFGEVKKGYTTFCEGDVLFAKITPCMENGKMAVVPALQNGLGFGSTEFHVLRLPDGISAKYLYYFVSAQSFRRNAEHNMTGAVGQRRVPMPYLAQHDIPIPPKPEQRRIVAKIEELFSELDKGVESLTTAREQLKVYRQSVLKHAFEGKLTESWRQKQRGLPSAKNIRDLLGVARIAQIAKKLGRVRKLSQIAPLPAEVLAILPAIPSEWAWEKLGWLTCGVDYGTSAKSSKTGCVPVLRMGNIQKGIIDWSDLVYTDDCEEIEQYTLQAGDVLFNRTNSPELVGKTAIYRGERPAIFAGYLIRINHNEAIVDGNYLNFYLNSHIAKKFGNSVKTDGVNQSNINGEKLQAYPFPYCSLLEQREVVRILQEKLSLCDSLFVEVEAQRSRADALRESILKRAFTGQLVAQDLADEPATELLKRIRAEREESSTIKRRSNKNGKKEAA